MLALRASYRRPEVTMADETPDQAAVQENPEVQLTINGQYMKDLSFEAPNVPHVFQELKGGPDVSIGVDVRAGRMQGDMYQVELQFKVEGKAGEDRTAFLVELVYGCVATVKAPEAQLEPMLLIEVPRHLFPFARAIIADVTRDGGFPPLMITPIDFVALFRQRLAERQQAPGNGTAEA